MFNLVCGPSASSIVQVGNSGQFKISNYKYDIGTKTGNIVVNGQSPVAFKQGADAGSYESAAETQTSIYVPASSAQSVGVSQVSINIGGLDKIDVSGITHGAGQQSVGAFNINIGPAVVNSNSISAGSFSLNFSGQNDFQVTTAGQSISTDLFV